VEFQPVPLPDPRPRPDRQTDRRSDASGHQRHAGTTARPAAPHADLDQGKELAMHQQISEQTGTRVFFCDAPRPGIASQVACRDDLAGGCTRGSFPNSGSRAGFGRVGCGSGR
jgi:hypothetical protein